MKKKVLFLLGNIVNRYFVPVSIPILSGIARRHKVWEPAFFDTRDFHHIEDICVQNDVDNIMQLSYETTDAVVENLQKKIDKFQPDLIAITCASYRNAQYLATLIPRIKIPEATTLIIGGSHVTISTKSVLSSNLYDLVCVGEGETIFDEVLTRMENGQTLKGIMGTYFVDKLTKEIHKTERRTLGDHSIIWGVEGDFSLFEDEQYFQKTATYSFNVEASRGCPFDCNYCGNSALKREFEGCGEFIRIRPIDSLFKYMERLLEERPKISAIRFTDECFLFKPMSWLEEFSERYSKLKTKRPFIMSARAEFVNDKTTKLLVDCGVPIQVSIGVESGAEHILKNVCNRNCKKEYLVKAFKLLNDAGIHPTSNCMLGLPYETREDAFKTIELIRELKPYGYEISIFIPYPGTNLSVLCVEKGFVTEKETHDIKVIKMPELRLEEMDELVAYPLLKMPPPYLSREEIINLRRVYSLYVALPKQYYPHIERCEKNYQQNKRLYNILMDLRNKQCGCDV